MERITSVEKKLNYSKPLTICQCCGIEFTANRNDAKYCSSSCRSRYWLGKNNQRIITLTVPDYADERFIELLKARVNELKNAFGPVHASNPVSETPDQAKVEKKFFETQKETYEYLGRMGYNNSRLPLVVNGIYCDVGLTIKKTEEGWETEVKV
ncbi:MAG: hypothetical protein H6605_06965 [Flavobacteriales bacterium]|nr:hypothetical protein [Flavobacteriales bacterium]